MEKMSKNIVYKILDGPDFTREFFCQYSKLLSDVSSKVTEADCLYRKHNDNPIGRSIIAVAISSDGELAGARAFWRMHGEQGETKLYQPCDTVTSPKFQGLGVFSRLTKMSLDLLGDDFLIFNFPNNNSFPGYIKLGWGFFSSNYKRYSFSLNNVIGQKSIKSCLPDYLDAEYVKYLIWRFDELYPGRYNFRELPDAVMISNGDFSGVIRFDLSSKSNYCSGFSKGYVLELTKRKIFSLSHVSFYFSCNSRTVLYPPTDLSIRRLTELTSSADIITFMDTF